MQSGRHLIIAVDGYSSCGKSTFARLIARELNYYYIDSGAMYRAVALYSINNSFNHGVNIDIPKLHHALDHIEIRFELNPLTGIQETFLNGQNVEEDIRGIEVSGIVSKISQIKKVREKMVGLQRKIGEKGGVIMDGRDIGSTVFPEAALKIFMTAEPEIRAKRRYDELVSKGIKIELNDVMNNLRMRDHEDETRKESPLRKAPDAVILDNSRMTIDQQMEWFREKWNAILKNHAN